MFSLLKKIQQMARVSTSGLLIKITLISCSIGHVITAKYDATCAFTPPIDLFRRGDTYGAIQREKLYRAKLIDGIPLVDPETIRILKERNFGPASSAFVVNDHLIWTQTKNRSCWDDAAIGNQRYWSTFKCPIEESFSKSVIDAFTVDPSGTKYAVVIIPSGKSAEYQNIWRKKVTDKEASLYRSGIPKNNSIVGLVSTQIRSESKKWDFIVMRTSKEISDDYFYQIVPDLTTLPDPDRDQRPAGHWFGCPQDLCLEGSIDSIATDGSTYFIRREYYQFKLNYLGQSITEMEMSIKNPIDTFFYENNVDGGRLLLLMTDGTSGFIKTDNEEKNETIIYKQSHKKRFPNLNESNIDAAIRYGNQLMLITRKEKINYLYTYSWKDRDGYKYESVQRLDETFPALAPWNDGIDASFYDPKTDYIFFFNNDYHVKIRPVEGAMCQQVTNYNHLWRCPLGYTNYGVTNWKEYYALAERFRKVPLKGDLLNNCPFQKEPPKYSSSNETASVTTKGAKKKSKNGTIFIVLMIAVIFLLIFLLIGIAFVWKSLKKRKRSFSSTGPYLVTDGATTSATNKQSQWTVSQASEKEAAPMKKSDKNVASGKK